MKSYKPILENFILIVACIFLLQCGSNQKEKKIDKDVDTGTLSRLPSSWSGAEDWTDSPWQVEP